MTDTKQVAAALSKHGVALTDDELKVFVKDLSGPARKEPAKKDAPAKKEPASKKKED